MQAEEAALRAVVEKFFAAYGKKDLAGMMALWSEKSPDLATFKRTMQQQFAAEDYAFDSPVISRIKAEGEKVSLRATVELNVINLQNQQRRQERMVCNSVFIKEGIEWKVWRYVPAVNDLAEELVKAKSEAERAGLLMKEKELLTAELVRALLTQGHRFFDQGDYSQALAVYYLAQSIGEQIGDKAWIARTMNSIGNVHLSQGNYAWALEHFQKSLAMSEAIGDRAGTAITLSNIGIVHYRQGDYEQALEYYQKSLVTLEALENKAEIARILGNIGIVHRQQGNYAQALECYQRSLTTSEAIGDRFGVARTLHNIGNVHLSQGNYARALEYYQKSLVMSEAIGIKYGIAFTLVNIGNVYSDQGNYEQALEHYQKGLAMLEALENKAEIARTLNSIGVVHHRQDDYAQALKYFQKSLATNEAIGDRSGIAESQNSFGDVYKSQGNYEQALEYYQKSLAMNEALGDKAGIVYALINIGYVHNKRDRYSQAMDFAERAAALARQIGSPDTLWQAHLAAGIAYRALKQPAQARQAFADAINTIETMRTQVAGGEQEAQRFFESKLSPYLAMVDLLVTQNNLAEALTYAERAKSRVLLDGLYSGRVNVAKAMTAQEQEQERKLNNQLVSLNTQINRENLRPQSDQARLTELKAQLQKARLDYEAFQTSLYSAHPELRTQRGEAQALTPEQAAALLPDARVALLELVVAEDKSFLFVFTKNAGDQNPVVFKVFPIAIKQKELAKLTEQFRQQLAQPGSPVNKMAREIFDLLFKDAHSLIQDKDKLVIVPDGPLWEMPFQALLSPRNRYLIQDHAIAYTPSLTVLREMIKLRQRKSSEAPTLLAVGNPALGTEVVERRKVLMDDPLDPLPDAEKQALSLGKFYGPRRSRIYVGAAATEGRVKAEAGQYNTLHLATHGILNDRSPMYSHLVLARIDEKDKDDGLLEAWEILNLDLKADLAVLSACETARGRVGAGEGMIGLTWALFVAGVPTTVVSQWKVRSDSTAELMVEFHRLLQARDAKGAPRLSRAEALRQAALKLLGSNQYRHPFFWAGFVLVGDWR
jgi:CHAT domain-containing protein/Tfp pilus assembly protein PilF